MGEGVPGKTKLIPYLLDFIALAFAFGFVESLLAGRRWQVTVGCLVAALVLLIVAFNWTRLRLHRAKADIGFHPEADAEFIHQFGDTTLYRVAIVSKVDCTGYHL